MKKGFTLIELLIVIAIILATSAFLIKILGTESENQNKGEIDIGWSSTAL